MFDFGNLDKYQREAVSSQERNLLVVASPGSGKTTTIINRVKYLIFERGIHPSNIIVITFTKAAAENMKSRFLREVDMDIPSPFFGTFHGLFYKILKRKQDFNIIDGSEGYRIIQGELIKHFDEVSEDRVKEIINDISCFKTSEISMENFTPKIDKEIFMACYDAYENFKKEKNLLDFDDLQLNCKNLFLQDGKLLEGYRKLFKYILVDEFQDCDMLQISLLKLLNGEEGSLFCVGDEDQCIYGFRGSRPDCMVEFSKHFKDGIKGYLSNNYRCPANIVKASINLIEENKMRNKKEINAFKEKGNPIKVINSYTETLQGEEIANNIVKLKEIHNYNYEDFAILYRTNVESRSIIEQLIKKKIPFKLMDKEYNFYEHFICRDLIAYLKVSLDNSDKESFCRIINRPFRYIGKGHLQKIKASKERESAFEKLKSLEGIHPYQMMNLDNLRKDINYLNKVSLPVAIDTIVTSLGYHEYIEEYCNKYKLDIQEFEQIIDEFREAATEYKSIIAFLAHIENFTEELKLNKRQKNNNKDGVILSTIHGVKGMEYKNVFVINCNEEYIPHVNSLDEHLEEERRLFYVAITRAIENLWLCISRNIKGNPKETSRFISELNISEEFKNSNALNCGDKVFHRSFGEGEVVELDKDSVSIEFSGEVIRKFDALISFSNGLITKIEK